MREAPDHAERIQASQSKYVSSRENDGEELQPYNQVNDAVAGAKPWVRLLEGLGEYAIFRDSIQHPVRADDRSIVRARKNQHSHQHYEGVKD